MSEEYGKKTFHLDVVAVKLDPQFKVYSETPINTPRDIGEIAYRLFGNLDREAIAIFNLKVDGQVASCHIAGVGTVDSCIAHPRELMKAAILTNASSIILCHNHPSGDLSPSKHDIDMTARMAKICNLMQIRLLDHVIVGAGPRFTYLSMFDKGIIQNRSDGTMDVSFDYLDKVAERRVAYGEVYRRPDETGKIR